MPTASASSLELVGDGISAAAKHEKIKAPGRSRQKAGSDFGQVFFGNALRVDGVRVEERQVGSGYESADCAAERMWSIYWPKRVKASAVSWAVRWGRGSPLLAGRVGATAES